VRARKVSQRVGQVSAAEREHAHNARLDALENDDAGGNAGVTGDSDEEFVLQDSDDGAARYCLPCMRYACAALYRLPGCTIPASLTSSRITYAGLTPSC
jgi:hypothetical protein